MCKAEPRYRYHITNCITCRNPTQHGTQLTVPRYTTVDRSPMIAALIHLPSSTITITGTLNQQAAHNSLRVSLLVRTAAASARSQSISADDSVLCHCLMELLFRSANQACTLIGYYVHRCNLTGVSARTGACLGAEPDNFRTIPRPQHQYNHIMTLFPKHSPSFGEKLMVRCRSILFYNLCNLENL